MSLIFMYMYIEFRAVMRDKRLDTVQHGCFFSLGVDSRHNLC